MHIDSNKFNILINFFSFYGQCVNELLSIPHLIMTVSDLIILSINLYIIFLSVIYICVDGIIRYISVVRRHIRRIRIRYSSVYDQ